MEHKLLVQEVLRDFDIIPEVPPTGRYLSMAEAETIVDDTIAHVHRSGNAVEYAYLLGHRRRLATTLTMMPFAETEGASCLDIGCFGYMAFWAWRHLGYARVEGVELQPREPRVVFTRVVEVAGERLDLTVHNFDIARPDWPLEGCFNLVLLLETLEHINSDPSGVMLNVTARMDRSSTLVMSVPNSVSYKSLQEFLSGAPPWTYWFFHPDLEHEPRHCFEYTPVFLKILVRSSGLSEDAFRVICAYKDREALHDIFEIGAALSIDERLFGDTMIVQARKISDEPLFRYPDCIYDSDRYYRSTFPLLQSQFVRATKAFLGHRQLADEVVREAEGRAQAAEADRHAAEVKIQIAEDERKAAETRAADSTARVREALFLCDQYLNKEEGLRSRISELEGQASALMAQLVALEGQVRECNAQREAAEIRARELGVIAQDSEARFWAINSSSFWRATAPARRFADRFPASKTRVRAALRAALVGRKSRSMDPG